MNRLAFRFTEAQIQNLDQNRKCHRKISVTFGNTRI